MSETYGVMKIFKVPFKWRILLKVRRILKRWNLIPPTPEELKQREEFRKCVDIWYETFKHFGEKR